MRPRRRRLGPTLSLALAALLGASSLACRDATAPSRWSGSPDAYVGSWSTHDPWRGEMRLRISRVGRSDSVTALVTYAGAPDEAHEAGGRMRDGGLVLLSPYPGGHAADRFDLMLRRDGRLAVRVQPVAISLDVAVDGVTMEYVFVRSGE